MASRLSAPMKKPPPAGATTQARAPSGPMTGSRTKPCHAHQARIRDSMSPEWQSTYYAARMLLLRSRARPVPSGGALDTVLALGAALRVSRLLTTDDLGLWAVREPAFRWAGYDPTYQPGHDHRQRLVSGLECPFCVGYWVGVGVLASLALARHTGSSHTAWRFVAAGLTLNYVVGHVSSRID